jgi:hypothetical protein
MEGQAVVEMATRFRGPAEMNGLLAVPADWRVIDPHSAIAPGPQAAKLDVYTLGAVRDYVRANRDQLSLLHLIAHVVSPSIVTLSGPLDNRARVRETYVQAKALDLTDGFVGKWLSIEEFIIGLQSRFQETPDRQTVLALVSNITHNTVKVSTDDGISQTVEAKQGIVRRGDVTVPSIVTLTPFRTFREVAQPAAPFVLRVNGGNGATLPSVGLFEADGGAWRLQAVESIGDWLRTAFYSSDDNKQIAILA